MRNLDLAVDSRRFGGTLFEAPRLLAGFPLEERFLGIQDLVQVFEGPRKQEMRWRRQEATGEVECYAKERRRGSWKYGWAMALLEMLVDPVLLEWVPAWVREQYHRWNPDFGDSLLKVLREDSERKLCNREVLFATRRAMGAKYKKRQSRREAQKKRREEEAEEDVPGDSGSSAPGAKSGEEGGSSGDDDENGDPGQEARRAWQREEEPRPGDAMDEGADAEGRWAKLSAEERLSAAPPAPAAKDQAHGSRGDPHTWAFGGQLNPQGFDWSAGNFVPRGSVCGMEEKWKEWRGAAVRGNAEVVPREELDAKGQGFFSDILAWHERRRRGAVPEEEGRRLASRAARIILTGTAGTGKSRTVRSAVHATRERARDRRLRELAEEAMGDAQREALAEEAADTACSLAAPTGCAAFQMKSGAATIHRIHGVPVGFIGPTSEQALRSDRFFGALATAEGGPALRAG